MKTLFLSIFALVCFVSAVQTPKVDVNSKKTEKGYDLIATNNTDVQREFTVTLEVKGFKGYTEPVVLLVPAKSSVKVIELTIIPNVINNLKWKFSHKPKPKKK